MKKKILVFGGSGLVGSKFINLYNQEFEIESPLISNVDILKKDQIAKIMEDFSPDYVINFAAFTNVEEAENQKGNKDGICYLINVIGAKNVAEICRTFDKKLIHISTEYVFDGTKSESPYIEEDKQNPINWYGSTKYFAEQFVLSSGCFSTIVRICMPFSAFYELKKDVARFFLGQLQAGKEIHVVFDQKITPTLVDDISNALAVLVNRQVEGIYHVCVKNSTTPFEFAKLLADEFNLDASLIKPICFDEYNKSKKAKLLKYSWLDSTKFRQDLGENILHTIEESIQNLKQQLTKY